MPARRRSLRLEGGYSRTRQRLCRMRGVPRDNDTVERFAYSFIPAEDASRGVPVNFAQPSRFVHRSISADSPATRVATKPVRTDLHGPSEALLSARCEAP